MRKFVVTIEGKSYEVGVEEVSGASASAPVSPVVTQIKETKPAAPVVKKEEAKPAAPAIAGGEKLESPMPGLILNLKVSEGATVKAGDVVLVLEAMKMENDITATADGVISFRVQKGSNVDTGDVLAVIG